MCRIVSDLRGDPTELFSEKDSAMNAREALRVSMDAPTMIVNSYLGDLSDADILVRPVEGANHIAWQLGHLISSEHMMIESVCPGSMSPLPEGFAEKYTSETSGSDDPGDFLTKDEYMQLAAEQRAGTLAALEKLSDDDLDAPGPESMRALVPTVGAVFGMQPTHWVMHAGQWAVIRRKLGHPPLF